jgi:hypothetical protein
MIDTVDESLARIVRDKVDEGVLPVESPVTLWAGLGNGERCTACGQQILGSQVEFEPQYDERPGIRLHLGCHRLWEEERRRRGYLPAA